MYTLTSEAYNHGTITPLGEITVPTDTTFTYTVIPEDCYTVDNLLVNGVSYMNNEAFDGETLTLDTIPGDMLIQAYFQIKTYRVETEATVGGHITGTAVYTCGTDVTIRRLATTSILLWLTVLIRVLSLRLLSMPSIRTTRSTLTSP